MKINKNKLFISFFVLVFVAISVLLVWSNKEYDILTNGFDITLFQNEFSPVVFFLKILNTDISSHELLRLISLLPYFFIYIINDFLGIEFTIAFLIFFVFVSIFLCFRSILNHALSYKLGDVFVNFFSFLSSILFVFSIGVVLNFYSFAIHNITFIIYFAFQISLLLNYFDSIRSNNAKRAKTKFTLFSLFLLSLVFGSFVVNLNLFLLNFIVIILLTYIFLQNKNFFIKLRTSLLFGVIVIIVPLICIYIPKILATNIVVESNNGVLRNSIFNFIAPFYYQFNWLTYSYFDNTLEANINFYSDWIKIVYSFLTFTFVTISLLLTILGYIFLFSNTIVIKPDYKRLIKFFIPIIILFFILESNNLTLINANSITCDFFCFISSTMSLYEFIKVLGIIFFCITVSRFFIRTFKVNLNGIIALFCFLLIFFQSYYVFQNGFLNKNLQLQIPDYFSLIDEYISSEKVGTKTVLVIPLENNTKFFRYKWGYYGIGFLNLISVNRYLDPFYFFSSSKYNQFLIDLSTYMKYPSSFYYLLREYDIDYILFDFSISVDEAVYQYFLQNVKPILDFELNIVKQSSDFVIYSL
ncbi:MAG: hypothetical protein NZZ41_05820 [Candidatus Dojkabacteria bacterium]|nr:hypothetical protein [Candidatus Dojkabacteria bacterium]